MLTIEEIKKQLPDIKVNYKNKIYIGRMYGRANDFPTIVITVNGHDIHFEVAWETLKHCINKDKSIKY